MQLGYTLGTSTFKQAVVNWVKSHYNCDVKPEQVVEACGLAQFYTQCMQVYTNPGEAVVMLTPSYYVFINNTVRMGRKCY